MASSQFLDHAKKVLRASGFRPYFLVMGCCSIETEILQSSVYDLSRLGVQVAETPDQADVLFVGGWLNEDFARRVRHVYDSIQHPRYVIGIGTCAISGTPYISENDKTVLKDVVPVDVFVSGCPPGVEAYAQALLDLRSKVAPQRDQRTVLQAAMKTEAVQV